MLLSEIHQKIMKGVFNEITATKTCNCWNSHKINSTCIYKGQCLTVMVIYKINCKCCRKFYISRTQNSLKSRISTYIADVDKLRRAEKLFNKKTELTLHPSYQAAIASQQLKRNHHMKRLSKLQSQSV